MKIEHIKRENEQIIDEFIQKHGNLFQSPGWIKSNGITNYGILIVKQNNDIYISGTYIFCTDKEENVKTMYFPKGPIIKEYNEEAFKTFLEEITNICKKEDVKLIRMDYKSEVGKADKIEALLKKYNFEPSIYSRFWDYTWTIDINGITAQQYKMKLKEKTRYNINYAIKHGVEVLIDNSDNSIDKFYDLLKITSDRDDFKIKDKASYKDLITNFKDNANVFWAYKNDLLLSAAIMIIYGDKAYYIYGASSNLNRNLQSTFLLQYEMIKYAISENCNMYDMGGVGIRLKNEDKFYNGLLEYKKKFGGTLNENILSYKLKIV